MIYMLSVVFSAIVLFGSVFTTNAQQRSSPAKAVQDHGSRCKPNPDSLYVRSRVLDDLAAILNKSIPEYSVGVDKGFESLNERDMGFFVVDLTNPANKYVMTQECVDFINGHVYHVAPSDANFSLNHIIILEEGKLKTFRSVNCPSRGDRIEDVIDYVSAKLSHDKQRDEIIDRVRNYRKYGSYGRLHHAISICNDPK